MTAAVRFDHVGITVRDLRAVTAFFVLLGLEPDGEPRTAEGRWLEDVIGIDAAPSRVRRAGHELVRTVGTYEDAIRLCHVEGPEQIIVMPAQQSGS